MSWQDVCSSRREVGGGHSHHVLLSLLPILFRTLFTAFDASRDFTLEKMHGHSTYILERNVRIKFFCVSRFALDFTHPFFSLRCIFEVHTYIG